MKRINIPALSMVFLAFLAIPSQASAQVAFQSANVMDWTTRAPVTGAATLSRSTNSVQLRGSIEGLDKKSVYTAWWIIFNNPAACTGGGEGVCTGADLANENVDPAVLNASGWVTGTDGTGYFVGELETGPAPAGMPCCFGQLNDSVGAEIHIVFQTHGVVAPGDVAFEMTNPTGTDQFFAVFLAPAL